MKYKQLSDAELIDRFFKYKSERTAIRDELFARYYERFDQRIRAVLHTYGLPYSPDEFYYNEIFMYIYNQIFELNNFEEILKKWEIKRGKFAHWFLNFVVVNRVKNWLKKPNETGDQKNIEYLREMVRAEYRQLSLHESVDKEGIGLTLIEILPAEEESFNENRRQAIDSAISQLSPNQQLMLRLLFLAYQEIPEQDQAYLAAELNVPTSSASEIIDSICEELKRSPKYEQSEKIELSLASLAQQEDNLQWKLKNVESELETLFADKEMPHVDAQVLFKDIEQAGQELDRLYRCRQIKRDEYQWQSLLLQRQHIAKQLSKTTRKRAKLTHDYRSGRYLVSPSYKQLAQLLNLSEGTVASRINRTISCLKELLDIEETQQKSCTKKLEDTYWREEGYAG